MKMQFKTKDLYEASYLQSKGKRLVKLESEGRIFWFVFEREDCEKLSQEYWTGTGEIPPKAYSDSIRSLKDRVFARK